MLEREREALRREREDLERQRGAPSRQLQVWECSESMAFQRGVNACDPGRTELEV